MSVPMSVRRRRPIRTFTVPNTAPICDLNTTPLIDVMLVLLIMFIITVPIMTHKVEVDLPQGPSKVHRDPVIHRLSIDRSGGLIWDERGIRDAELPALLASVQADPAAELHLRADAEASYDRFDNTLAAVKGAGITRLGLVDNARHLTAIR